MSLQKDHSNRTLCSSRKVVYSITFTMHRDAGHSLDGIKLVRLPVKIVVCKCEALPCYYHAAFHYSRALNSYAVQSISKVSVFSSIQAYIKRCVRFFLLLSFVFWLVGELIKCELMLPFFSLFVNVVRQSKYVFVHKHKRTLKQWLKNPSSVWQSHFGMWPHYTCWHQFIAAWSKWNYTEFSL